MAKAYIPYSYQEKCLSILRDVRREGRKAGLVVMSTGLGKTALAAFDAKQFFEERNRKGNILYICHQTEILEQAMPTFSDILGKEWSYGYWHGVRKDANVDVLFATFQTMQNYKEEFGDEYFEYIIVDESHHAEANTYRPTIEYFRSEFVLPITATPDRGDLKDIRSLFGKEVFNLPLERALVMGYLTPVDYRIVTDDVQNHEIFDKPVGRLSIADINRTLFFPRRDEEIRSIIHRTMGTIVNPKVIVFCNNVKHCSNMAGLLGAGEYHSGISLNDRKKTFRKFVKAKTGIITAVDMFNEGVDVPEANILVFLRSTSSKRIFLQQLGRGLRKAEGKEVVIVLDFVGNVSRLTTLDNLIRRIEKVKDTLNKKDSRDRKQSMIIDTGSFNFDEEAINILELVRKIKVGYTKADIIKYLQQLRSRLGKPPSQLDIIENSRNQMGPSVTLIRRLFGRLNVALEEAGLPTFQPRHYTKDSVIKSLDAYTSKLGYVPTSTEFKQYQGTPAANVIRRLFGSYNNLLAEAGYEPNWVVQNKSREEMLDDLRKLAKILHRVPNTNDVKAAHRDGLCVSSSTYNHHFGGVIAAIVEAGIIESAIEYDGPQSRVPKDDLVAELHKVAKYLGRVPSARDMRFGKRDGKVKYSDSQYRTVFGSWKNGLIAAGLIEEE